MSNRFLKELDTEIDTVCKYMPKLEEALSAKKDSVLSSDHFSKDFLNVKFPTASDNAKFSQRIDEIKKKYKLQKLAEEMYDDTAKYGEKFVYCVPYNIAIAKLLANKPKTSMEKPYLRMESSVITESDIDAGLKEYTESYMLRMDNRNCTITGSNRDNVFNCDAPTMLKESVEWEGTQKKTVNKPVSILDSNQQFNLMIEVNTSGIIDSAVKEATTRINAQKRCPSSLKEAFFRTNSNDIINIIKMI